MGICINFTANPINPITKNPTATALEISKNSTHQHGTLQGKRRQVGLGFEDIPRLFGFVHLFIKNTPSLKKSRGMSRSCLICSDISFVEKFGNLAQLSTWFWMDAIEITISRGLGSFERDVEFLALHFKCRPH